MDENTAVQLTEDEAKLYDRQIRLWGIESQKSLRNAKILIISLNGLGAEVSKNLILSGVKSVTFMDDAIANEADRFSQFLLPYDKVGTNRAVGSIERAKELNPLVSVSAITKNVDSLNQEVIKNYDVVVAIEQSLDAIKTLDSICRQNKIKFFAADVFGMFGYCFSDLQEHEYVMEIPKTWKNDKSEQQTRTEVYPSFEETLKVDFTNEDNVRQLLRMEPSYFVFKMLMLFRKENMRYPNDSEEDFETLSNLINAEIEGLSYPNISDELIRSCVGYPVSPVCAILGAVVAQEIIKAISHRDHPNKNMFFFNPLSNVGHVQFLSS